MPATVKLTRSTPDQGLFHYLVRRDWEFASICILPITQGSQLGVELMIHSSFGSFAHSWGHIGEDWRQFLSSLNCDYAMGKLCPREIYQQPLDAEEFVAEMRRRIEDERNQWCEDWGTYPESRAEQDKIMLRVLDEHSFTDVPEQALFYLFDQDAHGYPYARELYDAPLWKVNPQVTNFWANLWVPFAEHLKGEIPSC